MTESQYRQLLQNRGVREAGRLFDGPAAGNVLRQARRVLRRRAAAQRALAAIVPEAWLRQAELEMLANGTLVVRVGDAATCEQWRRRSVQLQRQLAAQTPGLRRLVIALRKAPPGRAGRT